MLARRRRAAGRRRRAGARAGAGSPPGVGGAAVGRPAPVRVSIPTARIGTGSGPGGPERPVRVAWRQPRLGSAPTWSRCRRCRCATRRARCSPTRRCPSRTASAPPAASRSAGAATGSPDVPRDSARATGRRSRSCPRLHPGDLVDGRYEILGAWPTAASAGSTSARDRNISDAGSRPLGRPQGTDQHRRRRRDGGGGRRAPVPGRGRPPEHREDPRLRQPSRPGDRRTGRLHRDGVRRRPVAARTSRWPTAARTVGRDAAAAAAGPRVRPGGAARRSATCTIATCCSATSSRTT